MNLSPLPPVNHSPAETQFSVCVEDAQSVLDYTLAPGRMVITHTFVPPQLRGRGIAEALMKAAIAFAQAEKLTIEPVCSYAARYLERHPMRL